MTAAHPDSPPLLDAALAWAQAGVCVLPAAADGTKRPALPWQQYQHQRPNVVDLTTWLGSTTYDGIGIVCGAISGNLEMFELEGAAVTDGLHLKLRELFTIAGLPELWAKLQTYVEISPAGGLHWIYRVAGEVPGNTKLARRRHDGVIQVLMETRGEGGWVICAPSAGRTHASGRRWQTLPGSVPGDIPTLTTDEHQTLHRLAATFDTLEVAAPADPKPPMERKPGEKTPGDEFIERTDWADLLIPAGWIRVGQRGEITYWRRPGKNIGISASTGYGDGDWLYVFTTSTEFESERTYTKLGAYAALHHHGDYAAAASELRRQGYGTPQPTDRVLTLISGGGAEHAAPATTTTAATTAAPAAAPEPQQITTSLTDVGNALMLIAAHAHRLRYVPERGHWLTWQDTHWAWSVDDSPAVQAMIDTIGSFEPANATEAKFKLHSLNQRPINSGIFLARTNPAMRVPVDQLDADPYALNTPTGVVNLRTGTCRPGQPADLHTRLTHMPYHPDAQAPRWLKFLAETFDGDEELITFLQRLTGYSITGIVTHHVLPFLHGSGGNGKTVFIETVLKVIGDYGTTAPPDFLLSGGREDEAATARLSGQRMVVCSEVNQSAKFNEAKIKLLTGGDTITARFLYHEHFTFSPTHQLWLMANHQPRVDAGGDGFWRRLRLVPFTNTVPTERVIEGLADDLVATEGPGILRWVVDGARQCLQDGLNEPEAVLAATALYAEEEDALGRFVDECLHIGGGPIVRVDTREVRSGYEQWCFLEGEKPIPPQTFGRELRSRWQLRQIRSNGRRFYTNVSLLSPDLDPEQGRHPAKQLRWDQQ